MGPTKVKIVRCSVEKYLHHYHVVARLTRKEDVIIRNDNFEFLLERLGLELTGDTFW